MSAISGSAPGKVILCGEHAVVYGQPAIALPVSDIQTRCVVLARPGDPKGTVLINDHAIDLKSDLASLSPDHPIRKTITLVLAALSLDHMPACEIQIHSSIPIGGGLGSSASVAVALSRAVSAFNGHPLDDDAINEIAFEIERLHHKTPSGIDNSVITYGRPVFFTKNHPLEWLEVSSELHFLIANSGIKGSTAKAVLQVKENWLTDPVRYESIFSDIGAISTAMRESLRSGNNSEIGRLMVANHHLLQNLNVSTIKLDALVETAIQAGAYGAKMSGGGLGGNIIAFIPQDSEETITQELITSGAQKVIVTKVNTREDN
jgi:mevalonate kinase